MIRRMVPVFALVITLASLIARPDPVGAASDPVGRLSGDDRIATAIAVAENAYPHGSFRFVLARADDYADALAGSALAGYFSAPLLLTPSDHLDARVAQYIAQSCQDGTFLIVYLLGGDAALSPAIEDELRQQDSCSGGAPVIGRYAGANRYDTAVKIAQGLGDPGNILLATGRDFPDGLTAGAAAAAMNYKVRGTSPSPALEAAVLLTDGATMAPETAVYLSNHRSDVRYAVGGEAAAADPGAMPLAGSDRYETAVAVARQFFVNPPSVGVATGLNFPDALAGGAHIGTAGGPLLLSLPDALPLSVEHYLQANNTSISGGWIYGGSDVVSDDVLMQVERDIT